MIVGMNGHFGFSIDLRGHDSVTFNDRHLVSPFDFFSHVWIFPIFTFFSWDIFSFFIYRLTVRLVWVFCLFFIIIIIIMILRLVFFFLGGLVCLFRPIFFVSFIVIIMIIMMTIFIGIISHCGPVSHSLFSFLPLSLSLSFSFIPLSLSFSLPLSLFLFRNYFLFVEWGAGLYFPDSPWHRHWSVFQILITAIIFFDLHFLLSIDFMDLFRSLSLSLSFFFIYFVWFLSLSLSLSLSLFLPGMLLFSLRFYRTSERTEPSEEAVSVPTL